jgi:hypothetical protein
MNIEILAGLVAFAGLIITWALIPAQPEREVHHVPSRSTVS